MQTETSRGYTGICSGYVGYVGLHLGPVEVLKGLHGLCLGYVPHPVEPKGRSKTWPQMSTTRDSGNYIGVPLYATVPLLLKPQRSTFTRS